MKDTSELFLRSLDLTLQSQSSAWAFCLTFCRYIYALSWNWTDLDVSVNLNAWCRHFFVKWLILPLRGSWACWFTRVMWLSGQMPCFLIENILSSSWSQNLFEFVVDMLFFDSSSGVHFYFIFRRRKFAFLTITFCIFYHVYHLGSKLWSEKKMKTSWPLLL